MTNPLDLAPPSTDHDDAAEELVAARALGSIEPDDAERLAAHLPGCPRCQQLAEQYQALVDRLPLTLPEAPEQPELRARLLAAAVASADAAETAAPVPIVGRSTTPGRPQAVPAETPARASRLSWLLPLAALLLVGLGLGWLSLTLREQVRAQRARLDQLEQQLTEREQVLAEQAARMQQQDRTLAALAGARPLVSLTGTEAAPAARGQVVQPAGGGPPLLVVSGLPTLPAQQVYQLWVIADGNPASAGLLPYERGQPTTLALQRDLSGVQMVALTVEPAGGSPGPTSAVVLAGQL